MKFQRNNLNPLIADDMHKKESQPEVPSVVEEVVSVPTEEEVVVSTHNEEVVEEVVTPTEEVKSDLSTKTESIEEPTLEEKYAIPTFEPTISVKKTRYGVSFLSRETPTAVKVAAEDVKHIEGATEIPEGAEVVDGVEIVGDLAPEVEEELNELTSVSEGEIPTQPATAVKDEANSSEVKREGSTESSTMTEVAQTAFAGIWDKFVDNVIVPTLITCLEKVVDSTKDYILSVVAPDLKKNNPDVK